jgi:hypothetical protein
LYSWVDYIDCFVLVCGL